MTVGTRTLPARLERDGKLGERLAAAQREAHRLWREWVASSSGGELPGMYVLGECAQLRFLLEATALSGVCPMVAVTPVPGAPEWICGQFVFRGAPTTLVDLARRFGHRRTLAVEGLILALEGGPPVALAVDAVHSLVDRPRLVQQALPETLRERWRGAGDLEALCQVGDSLVPVLSAAQVRGWMTEALG